MLATTPTADKKPLDVWLKFVPVTGDTLDVPDYEDELADYEANTYHIGSGFVVQWYHTAVGLVSERWFTSYGEARAWLESEGFEDYSS